MKLDNGTQVSVMLEAVWYAIKKTNNQKAKGIKVKFRDYADKPFTINGL